LAKQQEVHSFEYSKFATEKQSNDLVDTRKHQRELWIIFAKCISLGILVLTVIICLALYLGREEFVLEIVRVAFYGGCGAVAGSYYQKGKSREKEEEIPRE
jgi:Na+/glutamate symporter